MAREPDDKTYAVVLGDSPVRLWGLTSAERLERQLRSAGIVLWRDRIEALPENASVMMLRGDRLYDVRVIKGLAGSRQVLLEVNDAGGPLIVAAHVEAGQARSACELLADSSSGAPMAGVTTVTIEQVAQGFDKSLRKLDRPFVVPITEENRAALERLTFSGAYRGITDLVTKWLWPVPAKWATHGCVRMGVTPNQVTALSLVLVIVAGVLFAKGEYGWGLLAGWIMTFLDTVDGKLARVTVTSTKLGNVFDHGIDLIHPPFWYLAWGIGLTLDPPAIAGMSLPWLYTAIFAAYIGGRACEGGFQRWIAPFSIYTWRPADSYFRLITARRNPNMIMLTLSLVLGRPDLGLLAVAAWTVVSTAILLLRVFLAARAKGSGQPPRSWLTEIGQTVDERALAVRVFTRLTAADSKV